MVDFLVTDMSGTARTLAGSESGLITRTGGIWSDGVAAVTTTTTDNYLTNDGYIYAFDGGFSAIDAGGLVFELLNGKDGIITDENNTSGTIDIDLATSARIVNHGVIHSPNEDAINFLTTDLGASFELQNTGSITANAGETIDIDVGEERFMISNHGLIAGAGNTLNLVADVANYNINTLINSGTILSTIGHAVNFSHGVNGTMRIDNSGTITGYYAALNTSRSGNVTVNNSGVLSSARSGQAVVLDAGYDIVRNTGEINGSVELWHGNDFFDGAGGVVNGVVEGGNGNDTLAGGANADYLIGESDADTLVGRGGDDTLDGGSGDDMILGGEGNDSIIGGSDNDTLNANSGDDTIDGDTGNDILVGQDGSDLLEGGTGNDTMDGGAGNDVLEGGADNDILRGRSGEDELAGGEGFDLLTGGTGADLFVFRSIADAGIGATRDQILDFEQGVDTIVIAGLSPGVFEFRGTAAFAPSGNPEIRMNETATGSTIVQIDNNGDGTIDAEIRVANVTGLTADDFVL